MAFDYELDTRSFIGPVLEQPTPERAAATLTAFYPNVLDLQREHHRVLFQALLAGKGATFVHFSAGRDRTGVAVALVLSALGVSRDTVIKDYLLSNGSFHGDLSVLLRRAGDDPELWLFATLPPDTARVLMGVDAPYLEAVFARLDRDFGGIDGYLDLLGVGEADRDRLRSLYLEP